MIDRQERYLYMLEVLTKDGQCIETTTFASKHNQDTVNWRVYELVDTTKYQVQITYLGIQNKKRKLIKLINS